MNSESSDRRLDQRLDYWRNVARGAEQDIERLRDAIEGAVVQTENDAAAAQDDEGFEILTTLLGTLRQIVNQPATPHQRAQAAYNAVNQPTPGDLS